MKLAATTNCLKGESKKVAQRQDALGHWMKEMGKDETLATLFKGYPQETASLFA